MDATIHLISGHIYVVVGFNQTARWTLHQTQEDLRKAQENVDGGGADKSLAILKQAQLEDEVVQAADNELRTLGRGQEIQRGW